MELCADIDIEYGIIATAIINLQTSIVLMYLRQMLRNGDAKWLDSECVQQHQRHESHRMFGHQQSARCDEI